MKTCLRFASPVFFSILMITLLFGFAHDLNAQTDSLADVFPLLVGNRWTYGYHADWTDAINMICTTDTGSVSIRIIQRIDSQDSLVWVMEERRDLVSRRAVTLCTPPIISTTIRDTTIFHLVESCLGQHQLYRNQNFVQILDAVLPYSKLHSDSTTIVRYRSVGSDGKITFRSKPHWMVNSTFTFRNRIGMERYQSTGYPATGLLLTVDHQLRSSIVLGVNTQSSNSVPNGFSLYQNYPNPFNPTTEIRYHLPALSAQSGQAGTSDVSRVTLKVFDVLGRKVATLVDKVQGSGFKKVTFEGSALASGVYCYRLRAGDFLATKRMLLIK